MRKSATPPSGNDPAHSVHTKPSGGWLWLGGAAFFLLVIATVVIGYRYSLGLRAARLSVEQSHRVVEAIYDAHSAMAEMEANQRGYLLTKSTAYLQGYEIQRGRVFTVLDSLHGLVEGDPLQEKRVAALRAAAQTQALALARGIMALGSDKKSAAARRVGVDADRYDAQRFRNEAAAVAETESQRLQERQAELRAVERRTLGLAAMLGFWALTGMGMAAIMLGRQRRAQWQAMARSIQAEAQARDDAERERAARAWEERFRIAQDLSPDGFVILECVRADDGAIVDFVWCYANPAVRELMRVTEQQLIGRRLLETLPGHAGEDGLFAFYVQVVEASAVQELEFEYDHDEISGWFRAVAIKLNDGLAISFRSITKRKNAEAHLRQAVDQRDLLLRELTHRVRNNLQVVASLLNLQARQVGDDKARHALVDAHRRILALAEAHKQLSPNAVGTVAFSGYLHSLCARLIDGFVAPPGNITLTVDAADVTLDLDQAIPLGLMVNELVTNSLKHAFGSGVPGHIHVRYGRDADGRQFLSVGDDGRGASLANGAGTRQAGGGVGLGLVRAFVHRMNGTLQMRNDPGLSVTITFGDVVKAA